MRTHALALLVTVLAGASCARLKRDESPSTSTVASASASAPAPAPAPTSPQPSLDEARYAAFVRPLLTRRGCDAGPCHGTFKGGGFSLFGDGRDHAEVLKRIDRADPKSSELVRKALGLVPHNGGKNLGENECDTRRLLAWIAGEPDPGCAPASPARAERFAREVAPALVAMGCAAARCHGGDAPRAPDLRAITAASASSASSAAGAFDATGLVATTTWRSPIVRAIVGEAPHHARAADATSCALRRVYGFIAGAPESTCTLGAREPHASASLGDFGTILMPMLGRRGCLDMSCHGGGAGGMSLYDPARDEHAALHDWLALTARIEDAAKVEDSTLLRTLRNQDPHGGGRRLGGEGDCFDDTLRAWIAAKPIQRCPPRKPPTYERFVGEIQAVLDRMTCSQSKCHGDTRTGYRLVHEAHDEASLRANYASTLRQIDYDFTPFSEVMLRMREPCAYSVVTAWIENAPRPACPLVDPDPKIFPRVAGASHEPHETESMR